MERDLRETPLYQKIEDEYRRLAAPGFGQVTSAGDLRTSPDGRQIAVAGTRLDALEGQPQGRICLAAADGSGMRQVTHGPNSDAGPRWSPDGRTLSFVSDRRTAGNAQLFALEAGSLGEARQLVEAPGIVEHHEWSPDGSRILLLVAGHGAEQTDALGSGTLGAEADAARLDAARRLQRGRGRAAPRALRARRRERRSEGRLAVRAERLGGEPGAGTTRVAAIVSEGAGEGAWYGAELVAHRSGRSHVAHAAPHRRAARLGGRLAGRHARRRRSRPSAATA